MNAKFQEIVGAVIGGTIVMAAVVGILLTIGRHLFGHH